MEQARSEERSLANLLRASRPEFVTPEVYTIHRGIDVILGLLLIANYLRSTGIFIGDDGAVSISISGPLINKPFVQAIFDRERGRENG
ncbi:MAG: hypothetical protein QME79_08965 [Bacillota bacterium]|nr:hypothetical protein [Bacillota bacterium]